MDLATRIVKQQLIEAPRVTATGENNPTQTRYAWNPYKPINLVGPDGTMSLYVQPHEIAGPDGSAIPNPYHRVLPKGQLIPFPTFTLVEYQPSPDLKDSSGRAILVPMPTSRSALEAVSLVLRSYSRNGFTVFNSMQGLEQSVAQRIFSVVQPFDYPLGRLQQELENADDRIEAHMDFTPDGQLPDYIVECLQSDEERAIAYKLRDEMLGGAQVAWTEADLILNEADLSIKTRLAGGQGKVGLDQHDRYLSSEMERAGIGQGPIPDTVKLENKIDYLVGKEQNREAQEEIARLKKELEDLKAAQSQPEAATNASVCGGLKDDGTTCRTTVKAGTRCQWHKDQPIEE